MVFFVKWDRECTKAENMWRKSGDERGTQKINGSDSTFFGYIFNILFFPSPFAISFSRLIAWKETESIENLFFQCTLSSLTDLKCTRKLISFSCSSLVRIQERFHLANNAMWGLKESQPGSRRQLENATREIVKLNFFYNCSKLQ